MAPLKLFGLDAAFLAWLDNATDVVHERTLDSNDTLSFGMPLSDPKSALLLEDQEVEFEDRRFIITDLTRSRNDDNTTSVLVVGEATYIELIDRAYPGKFEQTARTAASGLSLILQETEWTVGTVEDDGSTLYSISETNRTVLWLVRQWAKITGLELDWDTSARVVNLVEQIGTGRGVGFRYGKNLKSAKREATSPRATRLYAYGRNGLTISGVNGGLPFVENYSWYTSQGLSLADAKARFRKDFVLTDDRFLDATALKKFANKQLAQLSKPVTSYACTVLELADLTGVDESFDLGDTIRVRDHDMQVNVLTRIVKQRRYKDEPWRNEVELEYLVPGLSQLTDSSLSGEIGGLGEQLVFVQNDTGIITVTTTPAVALQLALTAFSITNGKAGILLRGVASVASVLTIDVLYDTDVYRTYDWPLHAGANTVSIGFIFLNIPEGSKFTRLRCSTSTGTFTVQKFDGQYWISAPNLAGGAGGSSADVVIFEEVDETPLSIAEDVSADTDTPIDVSASESVDETPLSISDTSTPPSFGLTAIVAASADDGYITATPSFDATGTAVEMGASGGVARSAFFRFAIPFDLSGRTITSATIEGIANVTESGALLKIRADDQADPAAPTTKADMDGRTRTTAAVDWDGSTPTSGALLTSANFATVMQELVDSYGASLLHVLIFIEDDGSPTNGRATMRSQDHATSPEPLLRVTFT